MCKQLRKLARQMSFDPQAGVQLPARRLVVNPAHEKRFKFQKENNMPATQGISAINDVRTARGTYRWLKKNAEGTPNGQ